MTPMQVIVAATRNGAQFLRLTDVGTIEANKSADFLVLDANPLDNITNTRKIASVYLARLADRSQRISRQSAPSNYGRRVVRVVSERRTIRTVERLERSER
jgi:cytosine/adenosine deaminase-related metal-dependent hydrolase